MSPQETVERALAAARTRDCIVLAEETSDANLRWAGNTLTTNGVTRSRRLTVIAIEHRADGKAVGVVSKAGVRDDQLTDVVRAAEQAASQSSAAEDAQELIAPATRQPSGIQPGRTWDDPVTETEIGVFVGFAAALHDAFAAANAGGRKLYGFAEHELNCMFLGTSTGLRLRHDQPSGRLELNAKSSDLERSAWAGSGTRDFRDIDVIGLDAQLAQRLDWAKRRIELPAGRYETLLSPTAVADLMIFVYHAAGAKDALDGRTVFSKPGRGTRVGERLATLPVTLRSDPGEPGLECAPFVVTHVSTRTASVFDNGLPLAPTEWIKDGKLNALIQTRHSAALTGLPVTPYIDNLIFEASPGGTGVPLDEMITRTGNGLLVNSLWYIRGVDPQTLLVTGLTRDGIYLVENGEVTGAVNNFRFNDSPVSMLDRLAEIGRTRPCLPREWGDQFPRVATPPIRVEGFNMSSVSKAS
ncbi:MAG TPA: TldD/PmbA family protein [Streptosporangiaceae bacterium]|nr:TldD/PmbA family protein [Streptosporangiaceae bacterium]